MSDSFRTLIVPTAQVELARAIAAAFGPGGVGMFRAPLSPTGEEPATHYVSTGYIDADVAHLVPCQTWQQDEDGAWVMTGAEPGDADALKAWLDEQGVPVSMTDILALYAAADVTDQNPFVAFGRIGVQIVRIGDEN